MIVKTLKWVGGVDGYLEIIDQRRLPGEFKTIRCVNVRQLYEAIKTLAVRGAPAIGVAGAYGAVLALKDSHRRWSRRPRGERREKNKINAALKLLKRDCEYLASSRPTAVNLRWAVERVLKHVGNSSTGTLKELRRIVLEEANDICREDVEMCKAIGRNGARFVKNDYVILTHCNAGALATAGQGTALSVLYEAKKQGKRFKVYADESRPLLQGARLTAWELKQAGIDVTVICDDMAGALMQAGKIDMVIVGADRIAANGDTANKIGTYSLSVLAKVHRVPFYIAAPSSTFDLKTKSGDRIPIEQRPAGEVQFIGGFDKLTTSGKQITPKGVKIYNPAFDVTPAKNITVIITERGVIERPTACKIVQHFAKKKGPDFVLT
ncbi:MAG: S-methyl-5-thioribose-1-phosphate isomerase [Sedimentisphaerales bacterium]